MVIVFVTGVCGCGKTTIGERLAQALHCPYYEADVFHSPANRAKMASGTALTDEDRWPWLANINGGQLTESQSLCSESS